MANIQQQQPSLCQAFRDPTTFDMITEATTVAAETFVNEFYTMLDSDRISFPNMFRADSTFIWDGNDTKLTNLPAFLSKTPLTQHKMLCFDAHPVLLTPDDNDNAVLLPTSTILITVQGDLSYGVADFKSGFQHSFILRRDLTNPAEPQLFYCASFNARLLKETLGYTGYKGRSNNNNNTNTNPNPIHHNKNNPTNPHHQTNQYTNTTNSNNNNNYQGGNQNSNNNNNNNNDGHRHNNNQGTNPGYQGNNPRPYHQRR